MTTIYLGEIGQHDQKTTIDKLHEQIRARDAERVAATEAGIPALIRLVKVAERDTGQSETIRRFLLGLYNGNRFPFNLNKFCNLDKDIFDDCVMVLTFDARARVREIHTCILKGDELFSRWAKECSK
ncbi:MAG: hypothetical protein PHY54_17875 [Methylococcales bacterium]|nr:hypothetical protein [Methylococcales bacterium]